jgi:hypothetical protein
MPTFSEALERHLRAIAAHDYAEFEATVEPEVRLVGTEGNVLEGRAAFDAHRAWFADSAWQFRSDVIFKEGTADAGWALARVRYEQGTTIANFLLFLLFRRDGAGVWKLAYDQGTPILR